MTLAPGDRVRLTADCARTFNRDKRHRVDWTARVGTVTVVGCYGAGVRWDGRRSADHWPLKALRKDEGRLRSV